MVNKTASKSILLFSAVMILAACNSLNSVEKTNSTAAIFPEAAGKWWYNSYMSSDCSSYQGFKGYAEATGKPVLINNTKYFEFLTASSSEYRASKRSILKDKAPGTVGIRKSNGKYYLHSEQLVAEGLNEQLLFDTKATVGTSWKMKWGTRMLSLDVTLAEKKFESHLTDTLYSFSVKQQPVASHVPEIRAIIFSQKRGIISYYYDDVNGNFYSIREDIRLQTLLESCDLN